MRTAQDIQNDIMIVETDCENWNEKFVRAKTYKEKCEAKLMVLQSELASMQKPKLIREPVNGEVFYFIDIGVSVRQGCYITKFEPHQDLFKAGNYYPSDLHTREEVERIAKRKAAQNRLEHIAHELHSRSRAKGVLSISYYLYYSSYPVAGWFFTANQSASLGIAFPDRSDETLQAILSEMGEQMEDLK